VKASDSGAVRTAVVDVATAHHGSRRSQRVRRPPLSSRVFTLTFGLPVWGGYTEPPYDRGHSRAIPVGAPSIRSVQRERGVALQGTHTVSWIGQIAGAESHAAEPSGDIRRLMLTLSFGDVSAGLGCNGRTLGGCRRAGRSRRP